MGVAELKDHSLEEAFSPLYFVPQTMLSQSLLPGDRPTVHHCHRHGSAAPIPERLHPPGTAPGTLQDSSLSHRLAQRKQGENGADLRTAKQERGWPGTPGCSFQCPHSPLCSRHYSLFPAKLPYKSQCPQAHRDGFQQIMVSLSTLPPPATSAACSTTPC